MKPRHRPRYVRTVRGFLRAYRSCRNCNWLRRDALRAAWDFGDFIR